MSDGNRKLEEAIRRLAPASPPDGLRGRVLAGVESERRASRRRWSLRLSAAAAVLVAFLIGAAVERSEIDAGRSLLSGAVSSRDEQAAKALAAQVSAGVDGKELADRIEKMLLAQLRMAPPRERMPCPWPGSFGGVEPLNQE